jgi:outer membrane lipoprotein-sorting protein
MRHLIMLAFAVAAPFQAAAQEAALPSVDKVLEKYAAAAGGAAVKKVASRVMTGSIDVLTFGFSGSFEQYTKAPNRQVNISDLGGFGKVIQCSDGKTGWATDPQQGLREMSAAELAVFQRGADLQGALHVRDRYKKLAVTGRSKVGEREAYVVEAQPPEGAPEKLYFDAQTGLLIRMDRPDQTGGATTVLEDFRDVDGVKIPFTIHQDTGQAEVLIKIREVRQNVAIDDARFAKPA